MAEAATIEQLIVAAANGAAKGVTTIRDLDIPVYLDEFEIEVSYSCETEFDLSVDASAQMKFGIIKSKINIKASYRRKVTTGLRVAFRFVGKNPEEEDK